jgi:hypothetical protein
MSVVFSGFPTKTKPDRHDIAEKYYNLNPNHKKLLDIFIYLQGAVRSQKNEELIKVPSKGDVYIDSSNTNSIIPHSRET